MTTPKGLDLIGDWSVDKLNILKAYSEQYAKIVTGQTTSWGTQQFKAGYIDGFAGAGEHVHKVTGTIVPGSPRNALEQGTKFDEYHFVDLDRNRVERLRAIGASQPNVHVYHGNCNEVLLKTVFPRFDFAQYRRALCFLDPYGMHLNWDVLATAGKMGTFDLFLNFPIMDINRNAKRARIEDVESDHRARMTAFWGDESWHPAMFAPPKQQSFIGQLLDGEEAQEELEKADNLALVTAFQKRLQAVAGFKYVPQPIPMKIPRGAVVYYLFFASQKETGNRIASHIMKGYR